MRCLSRSLNKAEQENDTTHRACLAVVWAILLLTLYLEYSKFIIRTDDEVLPWILNMTDATGGLARWQLRLSEFYFDNIHRAGIKHQAADVLSLLHTTGTDESLLEDDVQAITVSDPHDGTNETQNGQFCSN